MDMGEAMRQMADVKDSLDISVKQNFIDPLQNLQDKDLKEITVHYSSLQPVTELIKGGVPLLNLSCMERHLAHIHIQYERIMMLFHIFFIYDT